MATPSLPDFPELYVVREGSVTPLRRPEAQPEPIVKRERAGVPEAWPALLSREQLCAYVSLSWASISKVCPIAPVDLGLNLVRYSRQKIDEWVATLPPRNGKAGVGHLGAAPLQDQTADLVDRRMDSLERVRSRLAKS